MDFGRENMAHTLKYKQCTFKQDGLMISFTSVVFDVLDISIGGEVLMQPAIEV